MDIVPAAEPIDLERAPDTSADDGGLLEHEATFQPDAPRPATAKLDEVEPEPLTGEERQAIDKVGKQARYRAESQKATPEDVAEINALTKELRTKEADLAKLDPKALEGSARLRVLRRQIKAIESELTERTLIPKVEAALTRVESAVAKASTVAGAAFTDKEPDVNDYAKEDDPVAAWMKAWNRWDRKREDSESKQTAAKEASEASEKAVIESTNKAIADFKNSTPDFDVKTSALMSINLPGVLLNAIVRHDKSAQVMYHLAGQTDLLDEMILLTDGKAITDSSVAAVQRRLDKLVTGVSAAPTGSAKPPEPFLPPRPPNPVRTGPNRSGDDLPGDDASLAEHERAFSRRRK